MSLRSLAVEDDLPARHFSGGPGSDQTAGLAPPIRAGTPKHFDRPGQVGRRAGAEGLFAREEAAFLTGQTLSVEGQLNALSAYGIGHRVP